jgi:hypothetical protein
LKYALKNQLDLDFCRTIFRFFISTKILLMLNQWRWDETPSDLHNPASANDVIVKSGKSIWSFILFCGFYFLCLHSNLNDTVERKNCISRWTFSAIFLFRCTTKQKIPANPAIFAIAHTFEFMFLVLVQREIQFFLNNFLSAEFRSPPIFSWLHVFDVHMYMKNASLDIDLCSRIPMNGG